MKILLISLLVVSAYSWPTFFSDEPTEPSLAIRQQAVNRLLYRVTEELHWEELKQDAENFNPLLDLSLYKEEGKAVGELMRELNEGLILEQHHWYSLFEQKHLKETLMLFKVLMSCKTWNCFLNNAVFFRERMNEGEFVYAFYVSIIHSEVGKGIVLPPLYEITPHMFTNSEVIQKAYTAQMRQTPGSFKMEFTGSKKNQEQKIAYFGEDIGMNLHHVAFHMDYPFWWDDAYGYHLDRKGELFYWSHHQLTARFDSERLSNYLEMVDELYWDKPIAEGFAPHTSYRYGGYFPSRPDNVNFQDVEGIIRVRDMKIHESRIRDAIAHGFIVKPDGTQVDIRNSQGIDHLGSLIEASLYSLNPQYYGSLHNSAHLLLGGQSDPKGKFNMPPSVLNHFETSTRDPAFFRLHKLLNGIFKEHKDSLPPYTADDIAFPGVHLQEVGVEGELETYFEDFEFDLKMAVDSSKNVPAVDVSAHVPRLNHRDFSFTFKVKSDLEKAHAVVRVFLCPRFTRNGIALTMQDGKQNCIEMDKFWTKLAKGENSIARKSRESSVTAPDWPSFSKIIQDTDEAIASETDLPYKEFSKTCGIPNRMLLPKGNKSGMDFILVAAVTDGAEDADHELLEKAGHRAHSQCGVRGEKYPDHKPMGFPFDRKLPDKRIFTEADNINYSFVKVFHKE